MKKKIIYGLLLAVAMVTASSSFVSCKDYEGDDINELREQNASLRKYLDAQIAAIKQCNCDLTPYLKTADLDAQVAALGYMKTADLVTNIGKNSTAIIDALNDAIAAKGYITQTDLENYLNTHKPDLSGYATKADLDALRNYILLGDSVKNAYAWASYSYQHLGAMSDSLKIAYENAENAKNQSQINKDSIKILADSIHNVELRALENFETAKALANSAIALANQALDSCNILDAKIDDLDAAMKDADAKLLAQIDTLKDRMDAVEEKVEKLENDVANILGTLKKQITGVIIQATYSPVLGNGSLPLGIQTNLLAAYAGKATKDIDYFPSVYDEDYADGTTVLTAADQAYLQGKGFWPAGFESLTKGDKIISKEQGNAGKLYVTVNPTNIDFTGTDFDLVNSKGQISRMKLGNLQPCDEVLNFGWTRSANIESASSTGFYVADATVEENDIAALSPQINTQMFEKAFKEQLNSTGTGLVSYAAAMDLARAVYSSLEPLQRFGVRAEWQDTIGLRSYTSAFDIAATVVSPLGFGFTIPDSKYTRLPVFDTNYLKNKFHIKAEIKQIVVDKDADGRYRVTIGMPLYAINVPLHLTGTVNGQSVVYDVNPPYTEIGNGTYTGTVNVDDEDFAITINAQWLDIDVTHMYEDIFGQINTSMNTFNDVLAQANKRIDYLVSYIDKYNSYATRVNKFIRNANNLLQPVLLWCDGQNVGQLGGLISGNWAVGTVVPAGGAVALVPTTYTLELLAPAYKKSVVCTNVYKDGKAAQGIGGDLEEALTAVNDALKAGKFDLYEGHDLKNAFIFDAKSDYEGMTFEFAYTALDYAGKIAGRKFYLTVGAAE